MSKEIKNKIDDMSFEDALKSLEKIVEELDSGEIELERAIKAYEQGVLLKNHCERRLKNAQERIEKIEISDDNKKVIKSLEGK